MYTRKTEIRHLTSADVYALAVILDQTDSWKKLMRTIPKDLDAPPDETIGKYTANDMKLIEKASIRENRSCTEILIDEWGTSGKRRATVWDLRELLVRANLYRAADFVATQLLRESPPPRPKTGPAARVDISLPPLDTQEMNRVEGVLENMTYPETSAIKRNAVVRTNLNNEDFFEKCRPCRNKVCVEKSDMIKFSVQGDAWAKTRDEPGPAAAVSDMIKFSSVGASLGNIPSISTLLNESNSSKISHREVLESNQSSSQSTCNDSTGSENSKVDIPAISTLLDKSNTSIRNKSTLNPDGSSSSSESETTEETHSSLNNIPMLSALHGPLTSRSNRQDVPPMNTDNISTNLPDLSALNLGSDSKEHETNNNAVVSARNFNIPNLSTIANNADANEVYISSANIPNLSMIVGTGGTDEVHNNNDASPNPSSIPSHGEMTSSNANIPNLSIIGNDMASYASDNNLQPNLSIFNNIQEISTSSNTSGIGPELSLQSKSSHSETEEYIPQLSMLQQ